MKPRTSVIATALSAMLVAGALPATTVKIFQIQGPPAFLSGTFEGVRLDDEGALTLGAERERLAGIAEPFAYSMVPLPDGWAVGTGSDGKVLRVGRDGGSVELLDAAEPDIYALWADEDGTLFAGSSPHGKVYRIRNGRAEPYFDPQATYIWAIARDRAGALWVATGVEGKLFRVDGTGRGEVAWDSSEPHLRALLPLPDGDLLIGTVGEGRVVRRAAADGAVTTLYDSTLAEVVGLARAAGGTIYGAFLASEASFVDLESRAAKEAADKDARAESAASTQESDDGSAGSVAADPCGGRARSAERARASRRGRNQHVALELAGGDALCARRRRRPPVDGDGCGGAALLVVRRFGPLRAGARRSGRSSASPRVSTARRSSPRMRRRSIARSGAAEQRNVHQQRRRRGPAGALRGALRWFGRKPAGSGLRFSFRAGISSQPRRELSRLFRPPRR
ncbi:MAG: hypothetical protein R2862_11415 [Thermoanaerobaculia bacterium]